MKLQANSYNQVARDSKIHFCVS